MKFIDSFISWVITLCSRNTFESPRLLVKSYLIDYKDWNDKAYKLRKAEANHSGGAMQLANELYKKNILSKYCQSDFVGEPIAFGSESSHDPENETIVTEEMIENRAIITTKHTNSTGFVADYEYRMIKSNGKWFLEAVDYVDSDGKYPGL
ncbi:hypothetical protein [Vibrio vulnificus]|uniref:hypothetical protein n=1 Tax=Vibrio vulnificus TaxID=672 RepID=UPI001594BB08|nr:hypothetical protein [Vibrio vulnificus]EJE8558787.1 hypothetical protein [Vibrio vulnificus]NVD22942.1 hypothetical protein [Vibrio vulnificus]HDU8731972.1 hypothetical protein [Vibrio vulnificus]HDU8768573.1 hypothetical protein [Vibrio vulnificus]